MRLKAKQWAVPLSKILEKKDTACRRNSQKQRIIWRFSAFLILMVFIVFFAGGCSSGDSVIIESSEDNGFDVHRQEVLETYYSQAIIDEMQSDASPIIARYGVNLFSTSQYGRRFIEGTVDLYDVFDARIPENYQIFKTYARDNMLILNPPETETYYKYALAASTFVKEYNYDAVLFHPDEFHPVLTDWNDTWMYIREDLDGSPHGGSPDSPFYVSGRIDNRHVTVTGGINMEPINNNILWLFYKPVAGTQYQPFAMAYNSPVSGSMHPELLNNYSPSPAGQDIIDARQSLGIIPSSLSGAANLKVGSWKPESYFQSIVDDGFTFSGVEDRYTWSGQGHYVIPLDPSFWTQNIRIK